MSKRRDCIGILCAAGGLIHGFGERDFESLRLNRDAVDLERRLAAPFKSFESERFDASNRPAAIGAAAQQLAAGCEFDVENSGRKALAEWIARALPISVAEAERWLAPNLAYEPAAAAATSL